MIVKKRCTKCLMPVNYPGISFNSEGVCSYCQGTQHFGVPLDERIREMIGQKDKLKDDFEKQIAELKGKGEYDCLVPLSGGKDSCYLAHLLKTKYKLKILVCTLDHRLLNDVAKFNIQNIAAKLSVDHIYVTPKAEFIKRFYRYLILSYEKDELKEKGFLRTICTLCSTRLILGSALKEAAKREIPLVIAGHSPDQIMDYFYEIPIEEVNRSWIPRWLNSKPFIEEDKQYFWNPNNDAKGKMLPHVLFPFHVMDYPNPDIISREVAKLGLINKNNVSPRVTNCHLNWLLQYLDRKTDYEPLVSEFSYQIRTGIAERRKCLILFVLSNFLVKSGIYRNYIRRREINFALEFLDLKIKDIIKKLPPTFRKIDLK